jgi:hypothetical protein
VDATPPALAWHAVVCRRTLVIDDDRHATSDLAERLRAERAGHVIEGSAVRVEAQDE